MTTRTCVVCGGLLAYGSSGNTCDDCADDFGDCDNVDGRDESHDDESGDRDDLDLGDADSDPWGNRQRHRRAPSASLFDDPEAPDADSDTDGAFDPDISADNSDADDDTDSEAA